LGAGGMGRDADWFRDVLQAKGVKPCIPGRRSHNAPVKYDKRRYRRRNRYLLTLIGES